MALGWGGKSWQSASTLTMLVGTLGVAVFNRDNVPIVAICSAAVGGFVHEIFQSGGKVAYPQSKPDGLYLGSISGLFFGIIAGMLLLQGLPSTATVNTTLLSQTFFAGLGLKGVAEAAGGQATKNTQPAGDGGASDAKAV